MTAMSCVADNCGSMAGSNCSSSLDRPCGDLERVRKANMLTARMYAAGAANKSGAAKRVAIMNQGIFPAPENLQYLYTFTNDAEYACLAAGAVIQIVGVTSNSMAVADHAMSMDPVVVEDAYRLCEIIVQKANESSTLPESRRLAANALKRHATDIPGVEALAGRIVPEPAVLPSCRTDVPASRQNDAPRDVQIKAAFLSASAPRRCGTEAMGLFSQAIDLCGGDNNLISRVAVEIATENTNRIPWTIGVLSKYGSDENIPFLLGFTNDVRYCERAAHAMLCISGVTDEAIAVANRAVMQNPDDSGEKYAICSAIARLVGNDNNSQGSTMSASRNLAVSTLKRYSRTIPVTSLWADEFLLSLDPAYETSDDRKALLREVAARRVNDYQIDYATNALKRIDAKIQVERKGD